MKKKAVLYLRSSKDRSDVSIDAQRRELTTLAADRNLLIVHQYEDIVESAKSEFRPAFQELISDLRSPTRPWSVILMMDHSRLSRQPYVGHVFRYECSRMGVDVVFSMFPELDPISKIILDSTLDAMSVVHSILSKQKGLAGMAENISRGFRAGGRAPKGYRLRKIPTGVMREGVEVTKSVLEPSADAAVVARYLKARAARVPRAAATRESGIDLTHPTLIGMEWNALTYAGHTVWNRHNETRPGGGYAGKKMRERSEWQVTRDTHPALITDDEAEAILGQLARSDVGRAVSEAKRGISPHLLTGFLETPDGRPWDGQTKHYRLKPAGGAPGRYVSKAMVDEAVVGQLVADLQSDGFVEQMVRVARQRSKKSDRKGDARRIQAEIVSLNAKIARAMDLAIDLADPAPALRKADELEAQRKRLTDDLVALEREQAAHRAMGGVTAEDVRKLLSGLADDLSQAEPTRIKSILRSAVDRIVLDPETLECTIRYRITLDRSLSMASPRGSDRWATLNGETLLRLLG